MNITTGHVIVSAIYLALTFLPIIFRQNSSLRIVCILVLLSVSLIEIRYGLRAVQRNVTRPPIEQYNTSVKYIDAWSDGVKESQRLIDAYLLPFSALFLSLALIALVPIKKEKKVPTSASTVRDARGGRASGEA